MPVEWLNGSWISPGAKIGKLALIGAFTVNASRDVPEGSTWFGSPAIGAPPAPPIPNPHTHLWADISSKLDQLHTEKFGS